MDGLSYVLGAEFQEAAAKEYLKWDKEWMRYFGIHDDYHVYFYDMDTPSYALSVAPAQIGAFSPEEMYKTRLMKKLSAQIWIPGAELIGKRVLEMGCGPGLLGRMASRFCSEYIGIDASRFALHIASLTSPNNCKYLHLSETDKIRKLESSVDVCVGRHFFIHHNYEDSLWILKFLRDLTKPGGLISADFYYGPDRVGEDRRYRATDPMDLSHASALYSFEEADVRRIAEEVSLDIVEVSPQKNYERHFALFRTKRD